ncbi:hypothetical protein BH10PLA2_BH10PLA2_00340 [soil metagenome]
MKKATIDRIKKISGAIVSAAMWLLARRKLLLSLMAALSVGTATMTDGNVSRVLDIVARLASIQ